MKKYFLAAPLFLAGCIPLSTPIGVEETRVLVYPRFPQETQAIVSPLTAASIASISLIPFVETTPGVYAPISVTTGNPTTDGAADMLQISRNAPINPSSPFILSRLKPNKNYRVYGRAYNTANTKISKESSSFVPIAVGTNDAPATASLPIYLQDTPFSATASINTTISGSYDYLKAILYQVAGNVQVASTQTSHANPTIVFGDLHANTNYNVVLEAYRGGSKVASTSQALNIGNDNAPATATMNLTIAAYNVTSLAGGVSPCGVAVDTQGYVYVADTNNNRICKITPAGVMTVLAGNGGTAFANGNGTAATFNIPRGIAVDSAGNVFVADWGNYRIRKITPAGAVTTWAGTGVNGNTDGAAASATFGATWGLTLDSSGNLYVGDWGNNSIRKITSGGVVSTLTTGIQPAGIAVATSGNLYVADYNANIRMVTSGGAVSTYAGNGVQGFAEGPRASAQFKTPTGITIDAQGNLFVCDYGNARIRKIDTSGTVTTVAGNGTNATVNGPSSIVQFNYPYGVAVDSSGYLYVAELGGFIRKIQ